ncbi:MAG: galactitol-1-phosphate 5-dehydrogenase [Clostridiales Family XIII bacterium]|jgi:L-iditol 2-dehydrogenase|nr:galactitol-1-phosphate 5-dehydrogenase [Clostridiales Family XIII bacterium]
MKAWVLHGANDLRLEQRPLPALADAEALVRVKAAGVCGSDIPRIFETGAHTLPVVPGHEFAGVVADAGRACSDRIGKRVGVFPLIPCMRCDSCARGRYETCSTYDYIGSRRDGAFAEYVAVPAWNLIELPDTMPFDAAALLEPAAVALHALRAAGAENAESVAIFGAGPVGLFAAGWARISGAKKVFLVGTRAEQAEKARLLGFSDFLDINERDAAERIRALTGGAGADLCADAAGDPRAVSDCIRAARPGGLVVLIGNPRADMRIGKDTYQKILRKQLRVCGSWNSRFNREAENDWTETLAAFDGGALRPETLISHRFPLADLARAAERMRARKEYFCKVLICG